MSDKPESKFLSVKAGTALLFVLSVSMVSRAETWNVVARDSAGPGQAAHMLEGETYSYPTSAISVSDEIPKGSESRSALLGSKVLFGWSGLIADERYRIRATFLSEAHGRKQCVRVGNHVLNKSLELPDGQVVVETWEVPKTSIAEGQLLFSVEALAGPNAVVSIVEVLSTGAVKLGKVDKLAEERAEARRLIAALRPRYTPFAVDRKGRSVDTVNLNGIWSFKAEPPEGFEAQNKSPEVWQLINVPGEWVMQGRSVEKDASAGYWREFNVSKEWKDKRVLLRFDAVYSECTVWVNGVEVGSHLGGFTPFEMDITEVAKTGRNILALKVKSHTLSDILASGIRYAAHDLGGITRKVTLFAVPKIHISRMVVDADLDALYRDGILNTQLHVSNESAGLSTGVDLHCSVLSVKYDSAGKEINRRSIAAFNKHISPIATSSQEIVKHQLIVKNPLKWHMEHPHLYLFRVELHANGKVLEVIEKRFGFRNVRLSGNQLLVNGKPVKLRGVCRHEIHPLRGRSLSPGMWRKDAEIFREGNVNFVRTSHYPPAEEFLDACDELGMFVEDEAPFCWTKKGDLARRIVGQTLEMVERDRDHPSVVMWSTANESRWNDTFQIASLAISEEDPSRPQLFSYGAYEYRQEQARKTGADIDIRSQHYPGPTGSSALERPDSPVLFDEFCHLNAYNRHELVTDPGVRDVWGRGMSEMWESMWHSQGTLGGALWAAIDDTFFIPDGRTVGYGTWGPIDGWRRPKPEYWHMKKAYSPVKLLTRIIDPKNPVLKIENRFDDTNINQLLVEWSRDGGKWKKLALNSVSIPPRTQGTLPVLAETRALRFTSPLGFVVDEYRLRDAAESRAALPSSLATSMTRENGCTESDDAFAVTAAGKTWEVSKKDGQLSCGDILLEGPSLMVLSLNGAGGKQMEGFEPTYAPHTDSCHNWVVDAVEKTGDDSIRVSGKYKEAKGSFTYSFMADGSLQIIYDFEMLEKNNPRQVGIVFDLSKSCDTLTWKRRGLWSYYPDDHIGRLSGSVQAFDGVHLCGPAGSRVEPDWSWSKDGNELGSNDFRSTKENVEFVSLSDKSGKGIMVISDGRQHARAWVAGDQVRLLIADYNNPGAERFFRSHAHLEDKPLKVGDRVKGSVRLSVR